MATPRLLGRQHWLGAGAPQLPQRQQSPAAVAATERDVRQLDSRWPRWLQGSRRLLVQRRMVASGCPALRRTVHERYARQGRRQGHYGPLAGQRVRRRSPGAEGRSLTHFHPSASPGRGHPAAVYQRPIDPASTVSERPAATCSAGCAIAAGLRQRLRRRHPHVAGGLIFGRPFVKLRVASTTLRHPQLRQSPPQETPP